jgi:hypothetical protein
MTNGSYRNHADRLEDFVRELETWQQELTLSKDPLRYLYRDLADEHDGAVAALLEALRERDGCRYRLVDRGGIPSSLPEEARPFLGVLLAAKRGGDLPDFFTYGQVKELGRQHDVLSGRCWPEFRKLIDAGQVLQV